MLEDSDDDSPQAEPEGGPVDVPMTDALQVCALLHHVVVPSLSLSGKAINGGHTLL